MHRLERRARCGSAAVSGSSGSSGKVQQLAGSVRDRWQELEHDLGAVARERHRGSTRDRQRLDARASSQVACNVVGTRAPATDDDIEFVSNVRRAVRV